MSRRSNGIPTVFILFLICTSSLRNAEAQDGLIPGSPYTSARGAAMGGAYLPVGDDVPSALYNNPADIAKLRKSELEPLNFSMYGNAGWVNSFGLNSYKITDLNSYLPNLQSKTGTAAGVGGAVVASYGMPGVGFGMLMQRQIYAVANADGTVSYRTLNQVIPAFTTGFRLANGMIKVGYSLQWVSEATGSANVNPSAGPLDYNQGLSQGSAFSHNLGFAFTIPMRSLPTFNIVVRNVLGSPYRTYTLLPLATSPNSIPATDPMTFDSSFSFTDKLGQGVTLNLVAEDKDMTNTSGLAPISHLAFGAELSFGNKIFLRGGWQEGYPSYGFGLKSSKAELSFAYYTEEIGVQNAVQGDTRYMLQYKVRTF